MERPGNNWDDYDNRLKRYIEAEGIVDVPKPDRYGRATQMALPEKSFAQELLDQPIPVKNRIAHLIPYNETLALKMGPSQIARDIGASAQWVNKTATTIGLLPRNGEYSSLDHDLLEEEWRWIQAYNNLKDNLTETAIAGFVAKSPQWVRQTAYELSVYPEDGINVGRERSLYTKTLIPQLRHILLMYPPAENWASRRELKELTQKDWPWIQTQLKKAGIRREQRQAPITGRLYEYIAPESRAYLKVIMDQLPAPAGDSLTIEGISRKIGRSPHWIIRRMPANYKSLAKELMDDYGRAGPHYSSEIWTALEELSKLEETDARMARIAIAKVVGRSWEWVESRSAYIGVSPEDKENQNYKVYTEDAVLKLKKLAEQENFDPRLSVNEIADILKHTRYWVRARLQFTTVRAEEKIGKNYAVYDRVILDQLRALPEDIITYGPKPK